MVIYLFKLPCMNNIHKITNFKIYSICLELANIIYQITKNFPKEELFGITSQLRRATSSIGANLAEGYNRHTIKDQSRFYYIAKGSITESIFFLELANNLGYIETKECEDLIIKFTKLDIKIYNYINYLKRQS